MTPSTFRGQFNKGFIRLRTAYRRKRRRHDATSLRQDSDEGGSLAGLRWGGSSTVSPQMTLIGIIVAAVLCGIGGDTWNITDRLPRPAAAGSAPADGSAEIARPPAAEHRRARVRASRQSRRHQGSRPKSGGHVPRHPASPGQRARPAPTGLSPQVAGQAGRPLLERRRRRQPPTASVAPHPARGCLALERRDPGRQATQGGNEAEVLAFHPIRFERSATAKRSIHPVAGALPSASSAAVSTRFPWRTQARRACP
jgi:hypothetical protein